MTGLGLGWTVVKEGLTAKEGWRPDLEREKKQAEETAWGK